MALGTPVVGIWLRGQQRRAVSLDVSHNASQLHDSRGGDDFFVVYYSSSALIPTTSIRITKTREAITGREPTGQNRKVAVRGGNRE